MPIGESKKTCSKCEDTGWVYDTKTNSAVECSCGFLRNQVEKNRLEFATLPEAFKMKRLSTFKETVYMKSDSRLFIKNAIKSVNYWLDNLDDMMKRGIGLYFHSNTKGSGKTRMAVSIANELLNRQIQVKFATSLQIINEIKSTWSHDSELNESKLLEQLSTTTVLIIDDFGTEQYKDWIGERFYSIINQRYVDNKVTIFTSNYNLKNIDYDERIVNRIKEKTYQIPFPEESVRERIAEENRKELFDGIKNI